PARLAIYALSLHDALPISMTAFTDVCDPRLNRLSAVRNDGATIDSTTNTTMRAPAAATWEMAPAIRSDTPRAVRWSVMIVLRSGRECDDAFLGELLLGEFAGHAPTAHDENAIAHVEQFG